MAWGSGSAGGRAVGSACLQAHCLPLRPFQQPPRVARSSVGSRGSLPTVRPREGGQEGPPRGAQNHPRGSVSPAGGGGLALGFWRGDIKCAEPECCIPGRPPSPLIMLFTPASVQGMQAQHAPAFSHPSQELTARGGCCGWTLPKRPFGTPAACPVKCRGSRSVQRWC